MSDDQPVFYEATAWIGGDTVNIQGVRYFTDENLVAEWTARRKELGYVTHVHMHRLKNLDTVNAEEALRLLNRERCFRPIGAWSAK